MAGRAASARPVRAAPLRQHAALAASAAAGSRGTPRCGGLISLFCKCQLSLRLVLVMSKQVPQSPCLLHCLTYTSTPRNAPPASHVELWCYCCCSPRTLIWLPLSRPAGACGAAAAAGAAGGKEGPLDSGRDAAPYRRCAYLSGAGLRRHCHFLARQATPTAQFSSPLFSSMHAGSLNSRCAQRIGLIGTCG